MATLDAADAEIAQMLPAARPNVSPAFCVRVLGSR